MGGSREWRQQRIADGLCVDCGKPRDHDYNAGRIDPLRGRVQYNLPRAPTATRCSPCAGKHHAAATAVRRKERAENSPWADVLNGEPLPFGGGAPRIHAVINIRIRLNKVTVDAIATLKARYKEECRIDRKTPKLFQLSNLVRQAIRGWTFRSGGYRPGALDFSLRGVNLNVHLDASTLEIVEREAAKYFQDSRAATIRAMLISTAIPAARPRTGGYTLSARQSFAGSPVMPDDAAWED